MSINHTNYSPLLDLPVSIPIETKKGSDAWDKAMLQMGIWQTAQFRLLASCPEISYLPGIIVMGHSWNFVVTVRDGQGVKPVSVLCPL